MKKFLMIMMMLWLTGVAMVSAQGVMAYIIDGNGPFTNIRSTPGGKVIGKISTSLQVLVILEKYQNGWWKLAELPEDAAEGTEIFIAPSKTGWWIHHSVVGFSTRNYGHEMISLRKLPDARSARVYSFSEEIFLHPIGAKDGWIQVKTNDGKHTGWIESDWICANPLTTCP